MNMRINSNVKNQASSKIQDLDKKSNYELQLKHISDLISPMLLADNEIKQKLESLKQAGPDSPFEKCALGVKIILDRHPIVCRDRPRVLELLNVSSMDELHKVLEGIGQYFKETMDRHFLDPIKDIGESQRRRIGLILATDGNEKLFESIITMQCNESPASRSVLSGILSNGTYEQKFNTAYSILTGAELIDPKK